jgi:general stress protein YciG
LKKVVSLDSAFYKQIGRLGGQQTKAKQGEDFFALAGLKGGEVVKRRLGRRHYSEMGRKSAAARAAKKLAQSA